MSTTDSIDPDTLWDANQEFQTAWSKHSSRRRRGRRAFGHRGAQFGRSNSMGERAHGFERGRNADQNDELEPDCRNERMQIPAALALSSSIPDFALASEPKNRLRQQNRAVSLSGLSEPPKPLRRHQRSMSVSSGYNRCADENFNPNWNPLGALAANTSPKRLAGSHGGGRNRKKKRPSGYSSDYSSVSENMFGNPRTFSQLSSFGEEDRMPLPGELGYVSDDVASPAAESSSSIKRNVCMSPFDDLCGIERSQLLNESALSVEMFSKASLSDRRREKSTSDRHRSSNEDVESDVESISDDSERSILSTDSNKPSDEHPVQPEIYEKSIRFLVKMLRKECSCLGKTTWTVSPPVGWEPADRSSFFHLAKQSLGFKVRHLGANTNPILQISKTMGPTVLEKLEFILERELAHSIALTPTAVAPVMKDDAAVLPWNSSNPNRTRMFSFDILPGSSPAENNDLVDAMEGLQINRMDQGPRPRKRFMSGDYQIVVDESSFLHATDEARLSSEHHANAIDLMSHLHGLSPDHNSSHTHQRLPMPSGGAANFKRDVASPYEDTLMSVASKNSTIRFFAEDQMETPMITQPDRGWGSQPIPGRDWGSSQGCDPSRIHTCFETFKLAYSSEELCNWSLLSPLHEVDERRSNLCLDLAAESSPQAEDQPTLSVGEQVSQHLSAIGSLDSHDTVYEITSSPRAHQRRHASMAKHHRMSLAAHTRKSGGTGLLSRKSLFATSKIRGVVDWRSSSEFPSLPKPPSVENCRCIDVEGVVSQTYICEHHSTLKKIFSYLDEGSLVHCAFPVSKTWATVATDTYVELVKSSIGVFSDSSETEQNESVTLCERTTHEPLVLRKSWSEIDAMFPWACFLSGGAYKKVFKAYNKASGILEAISVMDVTLIHSSGNLNVVAAELAVSIMLSSLVRRGICPNFILTEGVFSCAREPPSEVWGSSQIKRPRGDVYTNTCNSALSERDLNEGTGHFQYIRMELCDHGDAEEYMKRQPEEIIDPSEAQCLIFQIAFALHAAADQISMKHYDIKLLNVFLKKICPDGHDKVVLKYALGPRTFALRFGRENAIIAKLADYGTADVEPESTGQPVTIGQFTTLENTPPDFLFFGDYALQGHGHDNFGLGLCMLHAFTGHAPYEEILEKVVCPHNTKRKLRMIWEKRGDTAFSVIQGLIFADVYTDEYDNIIEGEPDEVLYDTLYRYLVLFGPPDDVAFLRGNKVWKVVEETLLGKTGSKKKGGTDRARFVRDQKVFSLSHGSNQYIQRARDALKKMDGAWDILMRLVAFDPARRASALEVLNSPFMLSLEEENGCAEHEVNEKIYSFSKAFSL